MGAVMWVEGGQVAPRGQYTLHADVRCVLEKTSAHECLARGPRHSSMGVY